MNSIPQIEAKHTPGPWEHDRRVNRTLPLGRDSAYGVWHGGVLIADVAGRPRSKQSEEEANARLIAAAPETATQRDQLLAVCRDLLDAFWDMSPLEYARSRGMNSMSDAEGERIKERARAAIAKATSKGGAR